MVDYLDKFNKFYLPNLIVYLVIKISFCDFLILFLLIFL